MKKFLYYKNIALLLALASAFTGCATDNFEGPSDGNNRTVTLKMAVPGANPATRAIGESQENAIQTIDVIAFAVNGAAETYDYWTVAHPTSDNVAGAENQRFTVELRIADYPQRFVVIANAHTEVNALIASRNWTGSLKSELLSKLEYALPSGTERWTATSSTGFIPIPMWGESSAETISSTTSSLSSDVYMMRMAARIDVALDTRVAGLTDKFKLKSVALYNTNTGGLIAPDAAAVQDRPHLNEHYYYVTGPSIPAERVPFSARNANAIDYTDFTAPGTTDVAMVGSIYTFEAAVAASEAQAPCLVVGGIYGTDTQVSYFRLDFIADDGSTRLPLMRNNLYKVNVIDVTGSGYSTPAEAFDSKAVNITANVLVWNNANVGDIKLDGQYSLSVSRGTVPLYGNAYTASAVDNTLSIYTDNPAGWKLGTIVDSNNSTVSWLNLSPTSGAGGSKVAAFITASANTTGAARTATIWITAGRLRYPVTVTQSADAPYLTVTQAAYYVMGNTSYTINVRSNTAWTIKSITEKAHNTNIKLLNNKTTDTMRPGASSAGNTSTNGDALTFTTANTPGNWGTIDVVFSSPTGLYADKTITLVMAAKKISIIGMGIATGGEGGDKYNLIQYNTSNTSNAQGRVNTAPQKMMDTPANFGTTAASTVICEPWVANWMNQNASGGTNYTVTTADVNWIASQNPDLVWIGGNGQWGDDISLLLRQKFLDKGKTLVCSIQNQETMWSMIKTIFGTTATSSWMSSNNYNSTTATFKFVDTPDPILDGPFRNIHGEYWGSQYTGSYSFAVQGASTDLIVTYSNGVNQSGGGQSLSGDPTVWTSMFRAKNTNWIWICDDGFVRNDTPGDGSVSPFIISQSTYTPVSKSYGNSPQQYVQNSSFIANMLAWVVARNPKQ